MVDGETAVEDEEAFRWMRQRIAEHSKKVAETKVKISKQAEQTKEILPKQADKIAKRAEEHERFITKIRRKFQLRLHGLDPVILSATTATQQHWRHSLSNNIGGFVAAAGVGKPPSSPTLQIPPSLPVIKLKDATYVLNEEAIQVIQV